MSLKPFRDIKPVHPGRSVFDLSYSKILTCDMGKLIPVMCDEVVPGDHFKIGTEMVIRMQPLVAPVLHEINATVHYFFVPYRLLWTGWENFITGGRLGDDASTPPKWDTNVSSTIGSLWDHLGFPDGINPYGAHPLDFPRRAYVMCWNEYYRDQTLQAPLDITDTANNAILYRAWTKDYFTSALPWQQRGTPPALPISGQTSAVFGSDMPLMYDFAQPDEEVWGARDNSNIVVTSTANPGGQSEYGSILTIHASDLDDNTVDLSTATTFDIADLRLAFQIQRWMERNARAGARYVEFLLAHYGVTVPDSRLQRPEYIGGIKTPIVISEVLQTSNGPTDEGPLGTMGGHGITVGNGFAGSYSAQEFGLIIGILSITPKPVYQQGINKQWLRSTRYDFYSPEWANLAEQAIIRAEIYANDVQQDNQTIFGYQGRFDEMRYKPNLVAGDMRDDFNFWHLSRIFTQAPLLNDTFIKCDPEKRIFAVPSEDGFIVHIANKITAVRPIPAIAEPGLIDH